MCSFVFLVCQNLANSCMHLTNYAVNKHNANFKQPTVNSYEAGTSKTRDNGSNVETNHGCIKGDKNAPDSDSDSDSANKRSLSWFLQWIAESHGQEKADSIFDKIGSIM
jgi:hypothetical protein